MEEGQVTTQAKKSSALQTDLEAQKLFLSKLEDECKKNFLDDKSLNKTLGQYKKAANELKNSINHFLDSKSVSTNNPVGRLIDEELKEKIDMLESTLKSSGIIKDNHNNSANGSTSQVTVSTVPATVDSIVTDNQEKSSQQSPTQLTSQNIDSQPVGQQQQQQQQQPSSSSSSSSQPQQETSQTQTNQPQQSTQSQSTDKKKSTTVKKDVTKKSDKGEPELKVDSSKPDTKTDATIKPDSTTDSTAKTTTSPPPSISSKSNQEAKDSESLSPERKPKAALNKRSAHKEKSTMDYILKNLNCDNNEQNQLKLLCKMYMDLMEENKVLDKGNKQHVKTFTRLNKEKEQLQSENNRLILAKSRLESLCRELQKHNKAIKEESLLRVKEEEEKHRTMAAKFQATLSEIMILVQESHQRNNTLRGENMQYEKKLRIYLEHYGKWEKEIEKILASKDLEIQLTKTKLAEANLTSDREKEKLIEENQQILNMMTDLHKKHSESITNENHLKAQLSLYIEKYDEFQTLLAKSNEMFNGFKKDMDKMSKRIKDLEKEIKGWKKKCDDANQALIVADEERKTSKQKIQKLENLCRALQSERNQLSDRLKQTQNIEKSKEKSNSLDCGSNENSDKSLGDHKDDKSQSTISDNNNPPIVNQDLNPYELLLSSTNQ
ncbi:LOW QUALITY PROTEIN: gamma-taxilin-like [Panonychus citri]|uniref:LOW QUALITY PROTEIN: gamma-taxilin-like n=1 Tax=Panonychus citri TaxID=50023 RepID=UPI0023075CE6|nr:LOW QUALITY PROTEIN: gamma-taxilin-like [Panonychus citri]